MQSMYKIARSYLKQDEDTADAIQDTILTCYEQLGSLKQNKYFKTWMTRILINKCNDILKKKKVIYLCEEINEVASADTNFDKLEWDEIMQEIDEKYRTILLLYYLQGFNTREIAEMLNMNEKSVQTRLSRGRKLLSKEYQEKERGVNI